MPQCKGQVTDRKEWMWPIGKQTLCPCQPFLQWCSTAYTVLHRDHTFKVSVTEEEHGDRLKAFSFHWTYTEGSGLCLSYHQYENEQDRKEGTFYLWTGRPRASGRLVKLFCLLFFLHFLVFHSTFFFYFFFLLFTFLNLQANSFTFKGVHFGQRRNWKIYTHVRENTVPDNILAITDILSALHCSVKEHLDQLIHCRVLEVLYSCPKTQWPR